MTEPSSHLGETPAPGGEGSVRRSHQLRFGDRPIGVRTANIHEIRVVEELEAEGWEVLKRGWPDFIAVRGDEVRFIEVKKPRVRGRDPRLSRYQQRVAAILARFGIKVELAVGSIYNLAPAVAKGVATDTLSGNQPAHVMNGSMVTGEPMP